MTAEYELLERKDELIDELQDALELERKHVALLERQLECIRGLSLGYLINKALEAL